MISIIIPTRNEAANIPGLIYRLARYSDNSVCEIIVTDGGSTDHTPDIAAAAGAKAVLSPEKGRAAQMNYGASVATGDILYFVHADTLPPASFASDILRAVTNGFESGRYRTKFDSNKWILKMNAFFTRFDLFVCYGGDQTFFITKKLFAALGGFNPAMRIMEDYDMTNRAKTASKYVILPKETLISARKYDTNSWLAVQKANYTIVRMYKKGASQEEMVGKYKTLLTYR